jgi:hypothetical protein
MMVLIFVNAALTAVCLAISSLMKTAEQASLVSIYLVGFQLPLSGAVLALPKALSWITQPFIATYWGWSGFIQTMHDTRFYDAMVDVSQTKLVSGELHGMQKLAVGVSQNGQFLNLNLNLHASAED